MYRKKLGFRPCTCLPGGEILCKAGHGARFSFFPLDVLEGARCRAIASLSAVKKHAFLFIPNRAKNLINIGLLALFFYAFVCKTIGRRIFL